jgi:hypothetical protein
MLDKFIDCVPNLLADILTEQQRTTAAITKLAEALAGIRANATKYAEQKAITTEPAMTAPEAAKATEAVIEKAKAKPVEAAPVAAPAADYAATAKKVTDLAGAKGREAAVGILAKFSAKTLKEIPADKFAEVIAACDEALA